MARKQQAYKRDEVARRISISCSSEALNSLDRALRLKGHPNGLKDVNFSRLVFRLLKQYENKLLRETRK